ncbi:MAG: tetraacyldisaccharide 4'-kinase [Phycisphaerales bacterium]
MSGPLPPILWPVAWVASRIYGLGVRRHAAALERVPAWEAPCPVMSVGNVSAGGTGKSPMVRWICAELRHAGRSPAIVMRGHRGGESSDEALEHRAEMPETPVGVGADRRAAIERLRSAHADVDALVLDDGFQHRQVARDLDLVLIDARRPAIDGALLPMGWLREPAEALRRAHAVIVTRADSVDHGLSARIERLHGRPPIAWTRHAWHVLRATTATDAEETWTLERLRGRSVAVWAGIGNPGAFVAHVTACGARVVDVPRLADHQRFDARLVERLARVARAAGATDIVCTGKDWVKLRPLSRPSSLRIVRPQLELECIEGLTPLRQALFEGIARGDRRVGR